MTSPNLNWDENSPPFRFALHVVKKLQEHGFIAYFAGGCVRDALMGNPAHDYDVATDARVEQVIELFGHKNTLGIGAAFGVACVHGKLDGERIHVEVATFRSDGNYSDGRRPDWVCYSSPEEDAKRRDFTINGMFYDPIAGEVKDFVGGRDDLFRQQIRAIGDPEERIGEDKLRMLRAIRFGARFGFSIEQGTFQAIEMHAPEIGQVSGERIAAELRKLFKTAENVLGVELLHRSGLLKCIWTDLAIDWQLHPGHQREACDLLSAIPDTENFAACLAAISLPTLSGLNSPGSLNPPAHPESAPGSGGRLPASIAAKPAKAWAASLKEAWKLSNADSIHVEFALQQAAKLCQARQLPWSVIQPILIGNGIESALLLAEAIQEVWQLDRIGVEHARAALAQPMEQLDPEPWLTGEDLKRIGIPAGPSFAQILREARCHQLDGQFKNRQDALAWAKRSTNAGSRRG